VVFLPRLSVLPLFATLADHGPILGLLPQRLESTVTVAQGQSGPREARRTILESRERHQAAKATADPHGDGIRVGGQPPNAAFSFR